MPCGARFDLRWRAARGLTSQPERNFSQMKKRALAVVPMVLLLILALGGCGKSASDGGPGSNTGNGNNGGACKTTQTISLGQVDFVDHCVTVSANQTVTFDDPTGTGGVHMICTGSDGKCAADSNAPSDLAAPGFTIQPGEQKQITFTTPGTYKIACTVHPAMNLTLTVK
jgi:plastocyanin